uniref:Uncharacterized protein n=1 Tax=Timema cristinae TaxID=61476 RepID=A0A7R9D241_TIMCR|nr:unnamed protein product [Timema cristinae]
MECRPKHQGLVFMTAVVKLEFLCACRDNVVIVLEGKGLLGTSHSPVKTDQGRFSKSRSQGSSLSASRQASTSSNETDSSPPLGSATNQFLPNIPGKNTNQRYPSEQHTETLQHPVRSEEGGLVLEPFKDAGRGDILQTLLQILSDLAGLCSTLERLHVAGIQLERAAAVFFHLLVQSLQGACLNNSSYKRIAGVGGEEDFNGRVVVFNGLDKLVSLEQLVTSIFVRQSLLQRSLKQPTGNNTNLIKHNITNTLNTSVGMERTAVFPVPVADSNGHGDPYYNRNRPFRPRSSTNSDTTTGGRHTNLLN